MGLSAIQEAGQAVLCLRRRGLPPDVQIQARARLGADSSVRAPDIVHGTATTEKTKKKNAKDNIALYFETGLL